MVADRNDPRRPLQLAIRSCRLLGIVFMLVGLLVLSVTARFSTGLIGRNRAASIVMTAIAMVYLIPGILYIVFAVFLKRRQKWAITATMVITGLHGILAIIACAKALLQSNISGLFVCFLWAAAMGQLIYHLSKSFEAIRVDPGDAVRGFEPLAVNTIPPPYPPHAPY